MVENTSKLGGFFPRVLATATVMTTISGVVCALPAQADDFGFKGRSLYVSATPASEELASGVPLSPAESVGLAKIAGQSQVQWVSDSMPTAKVRAYVEDLIAPARTHQAILPLAIYGIPHRDCTAGWAGGNATAEEYVAWVNQITTAIGDSEVMAVIEPDALAHLDCLPGNLQAERLDLIRYATTKLAALPRTAVYIDAGNARWKRPNVIADRLAKAGVASARGFALNSANFGATEDEVGYGREVSKLVANRPFVVDTSRNGNGVWEGDKSWCNPPGRALGLRPTTNPNIPGVDAILWIKTIGASDGACRPGDLPTGRFNRSYAVALAQAAAW